MEENKEIMERDWGTILIRQGEKSWSARKGRERGREKVREENIDWIEEMDKKVQERKETCDTDYDFVLPKDND